jgi:hypothetical protein
VLTHVLLLGSASSKAALWAAALPWISASRCAATRAGTRPGGCGHQLTVAPPASQAKSVSSQASSLRTGRSWTPPHILRAGHVGQALDGRHACDS